MSSGRASHWVALLLFFSPLTAFSQEKTLSNLSVEEYSDRTKLTLGLEFAQLYGRTATLTGMGGRFGFDYGLSRKFSVLTSLGMVTGFLTTSGYLYTGLNAIFRYSVFGSSLVQRTLLKQNGEMVVSQTSLKNPRLTIGAGAEQLFLSGSVAIVPLFGPTFEASYSFRFFSQWTELSARYGFLAGGTTSTPGLIFHYALILDL